jgi:protein-S-isoprenylcysteine O-methyltransferase Ste14
LTARRQARAIVALPGTAALLVPALILLGSGTNPGWELSPVPAALVYLFALISITLGFSLWLWTVRLFATLGQGTLAPWDPTRNLVVAGPYAQVRNPMITGVLAVLLGEAAAFGSAPLLIWAAVFFAINHLFFLLYEEPVLERRFGEEYRAYKRRVPRWLPRLSP